MLGAAMVTLMYTWRRGTTVLATKTAKLQIPLKDLIGMLERSTPHRAAGTAVFLTGDPTHAPTALLHNLKHNKILHERNVVLTVEYAETPHVGPDERVRIEPLGDSFLRVMLRFGFMDMPNIPQALAIARKAGWQFEIMSTSFYVSRRSRRWRRDPRCRSGRTYCSSPSPQPQATPRTTSAFPPAVWSR